jgi:hypothetical protein
MWLLPSGLVKRAVPRPLGAAPEGLAGMAELGPLFPGGGRRRRSKAAASSRAILGLRRANDGMHDLRATAQPQAQVGVAASNHRPLIALDPYNIQDLGGS